ncbi:MAG: 4Fe-4S dicluster domain-containing protein [Anaerolineales bacterium]|nr:4Fe-4S dicluster domain-containing protein [Anaerolineales bacterium]
MSNNNSTAPKPRWVFVMEPDRCINCEACMISCSLENDVPLGMHRNWIKQHESGTFPNLSISFMPENCHHCDNAPCVLVCPTGASYQRDDGLVLVDYDKCINCQYCMAACPYEARYVDKTRGVVDKCTFCVHRLDAGLPPACVETCVGGSRHFGDLNDPASDVSKLLAQYEATPFHPETGTGPNIYYINRAKPAPDKEFPLPVHESVPPLIQTWQKLEQPAMMGMLGAAVVVTGAAYRLAHRNAQEHFAEVAEALENEETAPAASEQPAAPKTDVIVRYRFVQRLGHAINALAFLILLITGLFLFFSPLGMFAGQLSRVLHRIFAVVLFLGPIFYFMTSRDRFLHLLKASFTYNKDDLIWLLKMPLYFFGKAGGLPPQGEINAGQRIHHATTIIFYNLVALSGVMLWIGRSNLSPELFTGALVAHDVSMAILTVLLFGHVYFTFVYGALNNMITGRISKLYAQVEHPLWLQELEEQDKRDDTL